jgi:uncharacterized protein YndB with AHSA1/START domain
MTERLGFVDADSIRQTHIIGFPPAMVWAALTEPERLADWFRPGTVELTKGGRASFTYDPARDGHDGPFYRGEVIEVDPERLLAIRWTDGSTVRYELTDATDATAVLFSHQGLLKEDVAELAGGWHTFIEDIERHLRGDARNDQRDWDR